MRVTPAPRAKTSRVRVVMSPAVIGAAKPGSPRGKASCLAHQPRRLAHAHVDGRQPVGVTDVVYLVRRQIDRSGGFTLIGTEGADKSFTDRSIPMGTAMVEYLVTPQRGDVVGEAGPLYMVQFGSVGRGVAAPGAMKMAA
jgi:hypothetical protein